MHVGVQADAALQEVRVGEVERLRAREELRAALASVDVLIDEVRRACMLVMRVNARTPVLGESAAAHCTWPHPAGLCISCMSGLNVPVQACGWQTSLRSK